MGRSIATSSRNARDLSSRDLPRAGIGCGADEQQKGRRVNLTVATVALLLAVAGCGGSAADDPYRLAASGLCEALSIAERGDTDRAGIVFYDLVHQPLHDLAAETTGIDREAAGRLLEAKEAVESGIDADRPDLAGALATLVAATGEALAVTGYESMPCSPPGDP